MEWYCTNEKHRIGKNRIEKKRQPDIDFNCYQHHKINIAGEAKD